MATETWLGKSLEVKGAGGKEVDGSLGQVLQGKVLNTDQRRI